MKDEIQGFYSTLVTRTHRKPRTASPDELPLLIAVADLPVYKRDRYRPVHILRWEEANGPVPPGYCLKCKGDKLNTDPTNWQMVPRGLIAHLNSVGRTAGVTYDQASLELQPTMMAVAKLKHALSDKAKRATELG
jgi:hypothetical protein